MQFSGSSIRNKVNIFLIAGTTSQNMNCKTVKRKCSDSDTDSASETEDNNEGIIVIHIVIHKFNIFKLLLSTNNYIHVYA